MPRGAPQLGCGTAIPSLYLIYSIFSTKPNVDSDVHVHLQDYNELVLRLVTIPNIILAWCKYDWNIPTIYLPRLLHLV